MTFSAARIIATRTVARRAPVQQQQKRGIVDYLTNYPDKVSLGIAIDDMFYRQFRLADKGTRSVSSTTASFS